MGVVAEVFIGECLFLDGVCLRDGFFRKKQESYGQNLHRVGIRRATLCGLLLLLLQCPAVQQQALYLVFPLAMRQVFRSASQQLHS